MGKVPFFLVWNEDGAAPRYKHEDLGSAEREADRLARAHRGSRFFVLIPVNSIRQAGIDRENYDVAEALGDDGIPF